MPARGSSQRLALFLPTLDDGGAERVMLQLGASFSARGHGVDLVLAIPGGPLASQVPPGVRVISFGASRTALALPALVRYLRRERPAALLSTLEHANLLALWAAALARTGVRVVLREANVLLPRGQIHGLRGAALRVLMQRFYGSASAVIAVSKSVEQSLAAGLGLSALKLRTIYNPVVTADLLQSASAPLDDPWFAPGAPPVMLGVGRLAPQKDFATLLRAFAELRALRPARLVILGEGDERASLEALAKSLGVVADVRLPGFDHNPFRYMSRAALFVLSSIYEGLPGALVQAMACGCRVISTDCPGGSREVLAGGSGILVSVRDAHAIAVASATLLDDAARGPARVQYRLDRFEERVTVDQYLDVLGVPSR